jgi:uncharacterized glyoxalase superfamily protein PhnB
VKVERITPILNVADLDASFAWFEKLGWAKSFAWCPPGSVAPGFGGVASGDQEIFMCLNCQGGRGGDGGIGGGGQGVWMSIWVDDVDAVYTVCTREHLEVLKKPEDESWGVREMHVRHPDGHVLRFSQLSRSHDHDHGNGHSHES